MTLLGVVAVLLALLVAIAATRATLVRASRTGLIQAPNARSSHKRPTPTGGGVGIVAGSIAGAALLAPSDQVVIGSTMAGGVAIAVLGLLDDLRPMRAGPRLLIQILVFGAVLGLSIPLGALERQFGLSSGWAILMLGVAILLGVYWINLFNFMDGIDGLAGAQALFMLGAGIVLAWGNGVEGEALLWWAGVLAASVLGFLVFNWPPAKIFMGDVGSTFLGLVLAAFALHTLARGLVSLPTWVILASLFVTDASVTLVHRLLRGERIWEAHRRHAYQALARRFGAHRPVMLGFAAVNVLILLPLAFWAERQEGLGWAIAGLVYAILATVALLSGAGRPEASGQRGHDSSGGKDNAERGQG